MFSSRSRESRTNLKGWRSISSQCSLLFSEQKTRGDKHATMQKL